MKRFYNTSLWKYFIYTYENNYNTSMKRFYNKSMKRFYNTSLWKYFIYTYENISYTYENNYNTSLWKYLYTLMKIIMIHLWK